MSDTPGKLARDVAEHLRFLEECGVRELAVPEVPAAAAAEASGGGRRRLATRPLSGPKR